MTATIETAQRKVNAVDMRIDAVRAELLRHETVDEFDAGSWQRAWDKHRALRAIEVSLFIRRADAVVVRDDLIAKKVCSDELREAREFRKIAAAAQRPCPTCGVQVAA